MTQNGFFERLERIDRRVIYLFVALSLSIPLLTNVTLAPAPMRTADSFFTALDAIEQKPANLVLISMDWGPGTSAENKPQTMVTLEHLMRKRIPVAIISVYTLATPFLETVPREVAARLEQEFPGEKWEYGKDWVNWGFRPGGILMIQGLAKSDNLLGYLKTDANGVPLENYPIMQGIQTIKNIPYFIEFTGLVGVFSYWVQFLQGPTFLHGCTSVTIPEAFIYYSSKQVAGFFEGLAGAAYYETLLMKKYETRSSDSVALRTNTGLSFAQLIVLFFILLGNVGLIVRRVQQQR